MASAFGSHSESFALALQSQTSHDVFHISYAEPQYGFGIKRREKKIYPDREWFMAIKTSPFGAGKKPSHQHWPPPAERQKKNGREEEGEKKQTAQPKQISAQQRQTLQRNNDQPNEGYDTKQPPNRGNQISVSNEMNPFDDYPCRSPKQKKTDLLLIKLEKSGKM